MRKILMMQVLTENGVSKFDGLYDRNGYPITAELEINEDGVVLTMLRRELTEEEMQATCDKYDDCGECPIRSICAEDFGSDNLF